MHLNQIFVPTVTRSTAAAPQPTPPVAHEDEESSLFGDVMSTNARQRFKRELEMLKVSNPPLYDKIVNMK